MANSIYLEKRKIDNKVIEKKQEIKYNFKIKDTTIDKELKKKWRIKQ